MKLNRTFKFTVFKRELSFDLLFLAAAMVSFLLHLWIIFSTPIILQSDSGIYICASTFFSESQGFEGVGMIRTPGYPLILSIFIFLFGSNSDFPYQIATHAVGFSEVIVIYLIARTLTGNMLFSGFTMLSAALCVQKAAYCNSVLTETYFSFFVCAAILFSLLAVKRQSLPSWFTAELLFSAATMIRPQGAMFLYINTSLAIAYLVLCLLRTLKRAAVGFPPQANSLKKTSAYIVLGILIAFYPVLWWSFQQYYNYGFFRLTNYSGVCLYDGIINYGNIIDYESPNIKECRRVFDLYKEKRKAEGCPLEDRVTFLFHWPMCHALTECYKDSTKAADMMGRAARDSIMKYPFRTLAMWMKRAWVASYSVDAYVYYTNCLAEKPENNPLPFVKDPRARYRQWLEDFPEYRKIFHLEIGRENLINRVYSNFIANLFHQLKSHRILRTSALLSFAGMFLWIFMKDKLLFAAYVLYVLPGYFLPFLVTTVQYRHRNAMESHLILLMVVSIWVISRFLAFLHGKYLKPCIQKRFIRGR